MKRAVLTFTILAASVASAHAQVKMTWTAEEMDNGAVLTLGVPETDNSVISLVCNKGNPTVLLTSHVGSKGLKANDPARIILTAGKVKKEFTGKAVANEESASVDVEAGGSFADVKAVLAGGKTMTLEVKGVKQQAPLDGAPDAFATFAAACQ
ncbi:MAG: hypothetical protein AB1592_17490 [Pseudomonadota bacterium]